MLIDNRDSFTASLAEACRAAGAKVEMLSNGVAAGDALGHALRHGALHHALAGPGRAARCGVLHGADRAGRGAGAR